MNRMAARFILMQLLLISFCGYAQVNDAGFWMSVNIEKKITPVLSAAFTQELRMNENITEAGTIFSDLGLQYKAGKHLKFAAMYRYSKKRRLDDSYDTRSSQYVDFAYKQDIKPLILNLRMRYQLKNAELFSQDEEVSSANLLIPKLTIKYDLGLRYEPYVFAEPYYEMSATSDKMLGQLRLCGGVEYTFNRMHSLDLHYFYQKEYTSHQPFTDYVIGLDYSFTF
jgi:hypothetical protein